MTKQPAIVTMKYQLQRPASLLLSVVNCVCSRHDVSPFNMHSFPSKQTSIGWDELLTCAY